MTLFDSGSQATIIFESWYDKHLSHIPLQSVTDLAIWGLSESDNSYPYRGYLQVELEFPENTKGKVETVPVLALVCPDSHSADNIPILIGTNVSKFRPFSATHEMNTSDNIQSMRVCADQQKSPPLPVAEPVKIAPADSPAAEVKWFGPGPLVIPAGSEYVATCKVQEKQPVDDSILITERAPSPALPASVLVQPTVLFSKMMDKNKFLVLLRNESLKDTSIPMGTVIAHLHVADMVT